ncbi:hypothetical protein FWH30_00360 [Microgenomates group bacterium]|nr:hypothetical protein [Microgenomates group bacterium]
MVKTLLNKIPFSLTLFKFNIRTNIFFWGILTLVMSFYICEIVFIFDPSAMQALESILEMYPQEFMSAFGMSDLGGNLAQLLAGFFYGMLVYVVPMIYYINVANRLIAKMVDNGSLVYLLQTPLSRLKIVITQAIFLLLSLFLMFVLVFLVALGMSNSMFPGQLDVVALARLHFSTYFLSALMASICFFYSCYFNETRLSLAFGASIPVVFLLMQMLGGISENLKIFLDLSIFAVIDPRAVVDNGNPLALNLAFIALTILFISLGSWVFKRKKLPI